MKIQKRFTLSAMFLLVTAVAVVLGYAEWRRLSLVSEVQRLNDANIWFVEHGGRHGMSWPDVQLRVTDNFWARVEPQQIGVMISIDRFGRCSLKHHADWTTLEETESRLEELRQTLKGIGVAEVDYNAWGFIGHGYHAGPSTNLGFLRATHSEWSPYRDANDLWFWESGPE